MNEMLKDVGCFYAKFRYIYVKKSNWIWVVVEYVFLKLLSCRVHQKPSSNFLSFFFVIEQISRGLSLYRNNFISDESCDCSFYLSLSTTKKSGIKRHLDFFASQSIRAKTAPNWVYEKFRTGSLITHLNQHIQQHTFSWSICCFTFRKTFTFLENFHIFNNAASHNSTQKSRLFYSLRIETPKTFDILILAIFWKKKQELF